jgi:UDP-N-acetylmuramate: L-alanyl-gamma-D-glutamyl-meso-diaminopimelate ligase
VEFDHADIYDTWSDYRDAFREFARTVNLAGSLVLNADDPEVRALARHTGARVVTYGLAAADLDVTAGSISSEGDGQRFTLVRRGTDLGSFFLPMSGRHNLSNALAVCAVALGEGVTPRALREGLATFAGIRRRQEIRGEVDRVTVLDDFAHHPTAVRATIDAVRERWPERRLVAVFEPRSNSSRRKIFEEGYMRAFDRADAVFLCTPPFRHNDRAEDFMDIGRVTASLERRGIHTALGRDADELLPALLAWIRPGDVVLVMSNGGFGNIHARLLAALADRAPA